MFFLQFTSDEPTMVVDGTKMPKSPTKLIGIAQWLQRRLLWMTGKGDQIKTDQYQNQNNNLKILMLSIIFYVELTR